MVGDVVALGLDEVEGPVVRFRPLVDDDLSTMHAWLNEPGVVRWWEGDDVSPEAVARDYGGRRTDEVEHWIAVVDGRDVGWIQCYPITTSPQEAAAWEAHGVPSTAAGIDYLLGDPADRGRGIGTAVLRAFALGVVFLRHPDWTHAAASPMVANEASWRALAAAGFRHVADLPAADGDEGPSRLMAVERSDLVPPPRPRATGRVTLR